MAKQIKVNGAKSDWYKEAVFILKDEEIGRSRPKNLVEYADQIIEKHMKLGGGKKVCENKVYETSQTKWVDYFFWGSIGLFIVVCGMYFLL